MRGPRQVQETVKQPLSLVYCTDTDCIRFQHGNWYRCISRSDTWCVQLYPGPFGESTLLPVCLRKTSPDKTLVLLNHFHDEQFAFKLGHYQRPCLGTHLI